MAKEYLKSKGIEYQDIDVSGDKESLREMVMLSGQMGVPVIVIEDQVIIGFDKNKIDSLLGLG
jgi:glutaredoxin